MEPYEFKLEVISDPDPGRPNYSSLGISKERADELDESCEKIANDDSIKTNTGVLAEAVKLAQNNAEVVYMCYIIGMAVARAQFQEMIQGIYGQIAADGRAF